MSPTVLVWMSIRLQQVQWSDLCTVIEVWRSLGPVYLSFTKAVTWFYKRLLVLSPFCAHLRTITLALLVLPKAENGSPRPQESIVRLVSKHLWLWQNLVQDLTWCTGCNVEDVGYHPHVSTKGDWYFPNESGGCGVDELLSLGQFRTSCFLFI